MYMYMHRYMYMYTHRYMYRYIHFTYWTCSVLRFACRRFFFPLYHRRLAGR